NDMGREMDALHGLLDDLLGKGPGAKPRAASLNRVEKSLTFPAPEDDGGGLPEALRREGTWAGPGGRWARLEFPDENTLRLTWMGPGQKVPFAVTFARKTARRGEHVTYVPGERPQACLGRFGVKDGIVHAQLLFPEAPYTLLARIAPEEGGLRVQTEGVGFESGDFRFRPASFAGEGA
ncbi:MAG TPA: hypothetical protein VLA21_07395, partial [Candidatus Limnocylindria bacterium]|nr:hypothetical protein [Candidatus Limnocylindria bacterium]